MTVASLNGSAVVSLPGATRPLTPGTLTTIPVETGTLWANGLPSQISLIPLEMTALVTRANVPTSFDVVETKPNTQPGISPEPTTCPAPDGWYNFHTIVRGDTLSELAIRYETTLNELSAANCLIELNRLHPGDVLRIPGGSLNTTTFASTITTISAGTCTLLEWETANSSAVSLNGEPVPLNGSYNACPTNTSTFTLRVQYGDGAQIEYPLTIFVE